MHALPAQKGDQQPFGAVWQHGQSSGIQRVSTVCLRGAGRKVVGHWQSTYDEEMKIFQKFRTKIK
jgi:hypothetical protein